MIQSGWKPDGRSTHRGSRGGVGGPHRLLLPLAALAAHLPKRQMVDEAKARTFVRVAAGAAEQEEWSPRRPPPGTISSMGAASAGPQSALPTNGAVSWDQQSNSEWGGPMQGNGELVGGSWQSAESDSDDYYDGNDWGEPYPITDWGEGPWHTDSYSSWEEQGYDSGYGPPTPGPPPPPPPPPPPTTSQGSPDAGSSTYGAPDPGYMAGGYAFDPMASAGYGPDDEASSSSRRGSGREASSSFSGTRPFLSDITLLTKEEMEMLMPVPPTRSQTNYYQPKSIQERLVQIASSVGVSIALSKSAVLAAPVLLYPIWSPWVKAGCKNLEVYTKQLRCLGLWRAQVLEVQVFGGSPFSAGSWAFGGRSSRATAPTVRVLIGDGWPSGARVQLEFPYTFRSELLAPGEPVEALVLAKDATFSAFKVIREVYAPGLGLWLSDYPFIDKSAFLDVSLQIESERQAEAERTVDIEATWEEPAGFPAGMEGQPDMSDSGSQSTAVGAS